MKLKKLLSGIMITIMLSSTIAFAEDSAKTFSDVSPEHWAYTYITELSKTGVISGYTDGTFRPSATVTRAEWAKMLCVAGNISYEGKFIDFFVDVSKDDWFADYVSASAEYTVFYEDEDSNILYLPNEGATREDVTISLVNTKGYIVEAADSTNALNFADSEDITENYILHIASAVEKGLISGYEDNTFKPKDTLTRAQAATLLYRAFYSDTQSDSEPVSEEEKETFENLLDTYYHKLLSFDPDILNYIEKNSDLYANAEFIVNLDAVASAYGVSEEYYDEFKSFVKDAGKKVTESVEIETVSIVKDGDFAKITVNVTMIDINTSTTEMDITSYITEEEIAELLLLQLSSPEEAESYATRLAIKYLPNMYEDVLNTSEIVTTESTYTLYNNNGNWLMYSEN